MSISQMENNLKTEARLNYSLWSFFCCYLFSSPNCSIPISPSCFLFEFQSDLASQDFFFLQNYCEHVTKKVKNQCFKYYDINVSLLYLSIVKKTCMLWLLLFFYFFSFSFPQSLFCPFCLFSRKQHGIPKRTSTQTLSFYKRIVITDINTIYKPAKQCKELY